MSEKDVLLRDIEILERKKTGLEREVGLLLTKKDILQNNKYIKGQNENPIIKTKEVERNNELLDKKYRSIKIGIDEFTNIKDTLQKQVGDVQTEVAKTLTTQGLVEEQTKKAQEKFEITKKNIQLTIKNEVISLLDEIRVLETVIEQKKISYGDFLTALKVKNEQLNQKEVDIKEVHTRLEEKEHKLTTQELETQNLLNKLKSWETELKESDSTLQKQRLVINKLNEGYKGQSDYFKKEANIFINNVENWYKNIESKRKLIVAVSNLVSRRQYGVEIANEHIKTQKIWLEDQRVSLNSAWKELKSLERNYGERNK